ncbi:hypothetical protein FB192DRAFT_1437221 [Mucor lusitanicus]|uniref:Uncharacterized protein n=1 Tax=Mucor circinelloides f. lusitanicus TaxID=29924 RepID=A0A8H4BF26_MUCCL|nr:hypothetical protein FB192DRAFT_1437221 [Mucor lusitanicus]
MYLSVILPMQKQQRDEQEKQRASEENPSSSTSTGFEEAASSGSVNESFSSAVQPIQVDPVQTPPLRGLHARISSIVPTSPARRKPISLSRSMRVQGIDPGLVTMATGVATTSQCLLNSVNRFQALADNKLVLHPKDKYLPLALTAKMVNNGVGSNIDRKKMEKKKPSLKRIQKNRVKRKTRIKKFYQRKVTDDCGRKGSCITLTGNWSASVQHIKGHTRRSTKPFYSELAVSPQHHVLSVDENRSTITCSSCFKKTCKQPLIINGKLKRVAGAVICYNTQCPRRLTTKATTTNRDRNDA